jgi:competence protein ComEA
MNLFDLKEKINRGRFFIDKINYGRRRNFYFIITGFIFLITAAFIFIYINQKVEIKRKENILKSYYQESDLNISDEENSIGADDKSKTEKGESDDPGKTLNGEEAYSDEGLIYSGGIIKAYICGEVKKPGVYEIESGSRVIDLLKLAGGQSKDACLEIINLAQEVFDGQRVYIPSVEEIDSGGFLFFTDGNSENGSYSENKTININSAGLEELESLPGIGPVTAKSIIDYRNKNGLFKTKEELQNVTGIGEKKYEKIKQLISI